MSNSGQEEAYSTIFASLKHPIRRKILRMLSERPRSFSEIQEAFRIESSHLTYHLESLGSLLHKLKDGKYALSVLGDAAMSMMYQVEEAPKTPPRLPSLPPKWKVFFAALMVGLILTSSLCYVQYQTLSQLSAEHEQWQEVLEVLRHEKGALTYEYGVHRSVVTADRKGFGILEYYDIFNLASDSTMEMELSFSVPTLPEACLVVTVLNETEPPSIRYIKFRLINVDHLRVLGTKMTNNGTYSVSLPSKGWYWCVIQIIDPIVQRLEGNHTLDYAITLKVRSQGDNTPFFISVHRFV